MEHNFHKIEKELLQNPQYLFSHGKEHNTKCLARLSCPSAAPKCWGPSRVMLLCALDVTHQVPIRAMSKVPQTTQVLQHGMYIPTNRSCLHNIIWYPFSPQNILSPILDIHMNQNLQDWAQSLHLHQNKCSKTWLQPSIFVILNTLFNSKCKALVRHPDLMDFSP